MASAAGISPSQPQAQDVEPRTKGSVMATTLIGAHAFEHLYAHSIPLLATVIAIDLGLGALQVGLIVVVRSIFGGLTSVSGGVLVDLFHHRVAWVLSISTFMIGTGYLLMSIAPTFGLIICALALGSMGSALWHPPALGLLARRFPAASGTVHIYAPLHGQHRRRAGANGRRRLGAGRVGLERRRSRGHRNRRLRRAALLLGTALAGRQLALGAGRQHADHVHLHRADFILLRHAGSERPEGVDVGERIRTNWAGMKDAFRGTGMWAIFTVSAVRGMADRSLVFLIPLYLTQALGANTFLASAHVALMVGPGILAGPLIGALSDKIGRRPLIIFIMAATTLLTLGIIWAGQSHQVYTFWITLFVGIYGLLNFSVNNLTQAAAADIAAGRRLESSFLGLMWGNNTLFGAVAAVMIFGPVEWFDWQYGFYIAAGIYFVGLLVSLLIPGKPREPEAVAVPA